MQKLHETHSDDEVALVVIDPGESRETVRRFADQYGWTFDVLLDPDQRVSRRYGVNSHPRTYVIDRDGKLLGLVVGYRDWDSQIAHDIIEELIERGTWKAGEVRNE